LFYLYIKQNKNLMFVRLHWQQAKQSENLTWLPLKIMHRGHTRHDYLCPWHDYPWPWHDYCIICSYEVTCTDFENSLYAFGQSEKRQWVQCIIMYIIVSFLTISYRYGTCTNMKMASQFSLLFYITHCNWRSSSSTWLCNLENVW